MLSVNVILQNVFRAFFWSFCAEWDEVVRFSSWLRKPELFQAFFRRAMSPRFSNVLLKSSHIRAFYECHFFLKFAEAWFVVDLKRHLIFSCLLWPPSKFFPRDLQRRMFWWDDQSTKVVFFLPCTTAESFITSFERLCSWNHANDCAVQLAASRDPQKASWCFPLIQLSHVTVL